MYILLFFRNVYGFSIITIDFLDINSTMAEGKKDSWHAIWKLIWNKFTVLKVPGTLLDVKFDSCLPNYSVNDIFLRYQILKNSTV